MASIWQDIKYEFARGNATTRLIMFNIAVFVLLNLITVPFFLAGGDSYSQAYSSFVKEWFYLPASPLKLLTRPWTLFTYMFLHINVWHILFNMLVLFWFGRITNDLINNNKIIPLYLLGGLAGGILFMIAFNIFPVFQNEAYSNLVGASASVMAILLSAATLNPEGHMRLLLIGTVKLQYIALFLVVLDIISISLTNPGGHFAHLGGAFMGWFYIYQLRQGRDLGYPFIAFGNFIRRILSGQPIEPRKKRQPKMVYKKAHQTSGNDGGGSSNANTYGGYSRSFAQRYRNMTTQECVDAILEKIHAQGYDSLSEEEKEFLDKSSKK